MKVSTDAAVPLREWLTVAEVAAIFGVKPGTVYAMVQRNTIPHGRFGGKLIFNKVELEAWVRSPVDADADGDTAVNTAAVTLPAQRKYKKGSRKDLFG